MSLGLESVTLHSPSSDPCVQRPSGSTAEELAWDKAASTSCFYPHLSLRSPVAQKDHVCYCLLPLYGQVPLKKALACISEERGLNVA